MGDLTEHFSRAEFACRCSNCNFDTVDVDTLALLEEIREWAMVAVVINSACRCATWNEMVGGAKTSQHLYGRAVDIRIEGKTPDEVAKFVDKLMPDSGGIGIYTDQNFTHIDTRTGKARWRG